MSLTNAEYEEIMRGYQQRQLQNRHRTEERRRELYARIPRLKELSDAIATCSLTAAREKFDGDADAITRLHERLAGYRRERERLLAEAGCPADALEPVYTCPDCRDTGYIGPDKCHCFTQQIINSVYDQSNLGGILERENFSTFSYEYFSDSAPDPATGMTPLAAIRRAEAECRHFIDDFDHKPKNLFFYGNTGVGKTFLTNCVAKALLDRGRSVIYFTAYQFFDILSKGIFERDADVIAAHRSMFDCELLIIDDLGTEFTTKYTPSQLFLCVNERILREKSTILSTNLDITRLRDAYSERVLSRVMSSYSILKLTGDDIRIRKRQGR